MLFVPSAGGGIKESLSEVWTVQVLMTHMTSLHWQVYNSFLLKMKEKSCLLEYFLSAPEWERREGVGSDFNKILNLYSLLSNLWWFATCGASCLFPKVSIISFAKLRHRAVKQPAQSHFTTGWNHGLEIKYILKIDNN